MGSSPDAQFEAVVDRLGESARAYSCAGAATEAVAWDERSEITVRLSLRGDEVWLLAGSGILVRFVAASDGEFDVEGIVAAACTILQGKAREFFGAARAPEGDAYASGFELGSARAFAGGLDEGESRFSSRLMGPMYRATSPIVE